MLISFTVQNCRSFYEPVTLSMEPTKGGRRRTGHVFTQGGVRTQRLALLYGPNGAGKTNLLRALYLAVQAILKNDCHILANQSFRLPMLQALPMRFELVFSRQRARYLYFFETNGHQILKEQLVWLQEDSKKTTVFTRTETGTITIAAPLRNHTETQSKTDEWYKWRTLEPHMFWLRKVEEDGLRTQQVPGRNHLIAALDFLRSFVFLNDFATHAANAPQALFLRGAGFQDFLKTLIHNADVGITDVIQEALPQEEIQNLLKILVPRPPLPQPVKKLQVIHCDFRKARYIILTQDAPDAPFTGSELKTRHGETTFPLHLESDGTRRLFELSAALWCATKEEIVLVADEFDAFLHPVLVRQLLVDILGTKGLNSQFLLTTHTPDLLAEDVLHNDEVWMVEKRRDGSSDLYSLSRFMPRSDKNLRKGYLAGLYGAIPSFTRLVPEQEGDDDEE